ncbi:MULTISPECIES: cardiolipin synthase [Ramlibacter]|uniref:Cardiolipin synthase n=1 Tax=Ramlibacter aquaticus TaxID=2780094 RepID=A0ABR9SFI5_9BURK|nr:MULTISPECIES: cardiolipin synthase [Ramlibacter]MBE7941056.1 cardiolipin synthase [Ramlibacter aquaticus]
MSSPPACPRAPASFPWRRAAAVLAALALSGCASLPDTRFLSDRYEEQSSHFRDAWGPLSEKRSAAIVAQLKRNNGDLDILDRQTVLEQQIGGSALVVGNKVTLLQDGPATYGAMFAALRAARDRIDIESYIIEDGEIGEKFAALLLERQSHGVQVNAIYDSVGTSGTGQPFFDRLRKAGIQVLEFNPVNPLHLKKAWAPNHRDHRKLLVVDGSIAFLGGINISNVYSSGSSIGHSGQAVDPTLGWRDTDVQIEGPVVAEFEKLFQDTWQKQGGKPLAGAGTPSPGAPRGQEIVRAVGSTPDDSFSLMYLTLISAITNAQKQVYITNAYFVPDPQLLGALLAAARRGVDVRLILPSQSDSAAAYLAGRSYYEELLEAGVKIYERRGSLLHVKTVIVDGVWSSVGSSNLDWRSAMDNDEVNAVILGRGFAAQMRAAYLKDMAASDAIELEAWRGRPLRARFKEAVARLWGPLL